MEGIIFLVGQAAHSLLLKILVLFSNLHFQPAGSFTEILVLRGYILASHVLVRRVEDAFEASVRPSLFDIFRRVDWQVSVRPLTSLEHWLH